MPDPQPCVAIAGDVHTECGAPATHRARTPRGDLPLCARHAPQMQGLAGVTVEPIDA